MRASTIIKQAINLATRNLGESITLTIDSTTFTLKAVITQRTQVTEQKNKLDIQEDSFNFRFVLPSTAARAPREGDKIVYDNNDYKVDTVLSGSYDNIRLVAVFTNKRRLGDRRTAGDT